ncbi:MAG: hypothetical protein ACE5EJ_01500 [Nitrosopumilaceae archaeon]
MDGKSAGLTEIPRTERHPQYHQEWNFGKGAVREAFQRVFSPDAEYVLFQTIANQEAIDVLRQYVASRKGMDAPWEIRRKKSGDEPRYIPGASDRDNGLQFDNSLMDSYQRAIDKIAKETLGSKNYSHYSMVSTNGVHSLDRDPNAIFWPRVYIVNAEKQEGLKGIIDNLSGNESFEMLRGLESPQFYQMAEIETLHSLGISPLVRLPNELRVGAQDLSKYVDFLAQMTETYKWTGPVIEVD